jgi:hypothetical protein
VIPRRRVACRPTRKPFQVPHHKTGRRQHPYRHHGSREAPQAPGFDMGGTAQQEGLRAVSSLTFAEQSRHIVGPSGSHRGDGYRMGIALGIPTDIAPPRPGTDRHQADHPAHHPDITRHTTSPGDGKAGDGKAGDGEVVHAHLLKSAGVGASGRVRARPTLHSPHGGLRPSQSDRAAPKLNSASSNRAKKRLCTRLRNSGSQARPSFSTRE